jgi:predicted transcriptional regulator
MSVLFIPAQRLVRVREPLSQGKGRPIKMMGVTVGGCAMLAE